MSYHKNKAGDRVLQRGKKQSLDTDTQFANSEGDYDPPLASFIHHHQLQSMVITYTYRDSRHFGVADH